MGQGAGEGGRAGIRGRNRIQNKVVIDRDAVESQRAGQRETETTGSEAVETEKGRGRKKRLKKEKFR